MEYAMYEPISKKCAVFALALSATLASGVVVAQSGSGSGMGAGQQMMGQGQGMMGPGMMGPGMMGPGMMGQGMMGQGMMGPGMMGQGMMGPYVSGVLGLSDDQRGQMEEIQRENASEHWQMMQEMQQHRRNMMEAYDQDAPDPDEVGDAFSRMMETRRGMIEQQVRMQNRMREVLTEEQRKRLGEMRRFNWSDQ
jgi:Spy/CpxP family protein refolding chaperone